MILIKELENKRALFKCERCGSVVEMNKYAHNEKIKKGLIYCGKCNFELSVKRRTIRKKPDKINGVKIIEHLPLEPNGKRYVVVECPLCKKHYKKRFDALKDHPLCRECANKKNAENRKTHGLSNTRLFKIWQSMMSRCHWGEKEQRYHKWYKDKNVTVCDEWRNDFKSFYDWAINNGYRDDLVLDKDILCDLKGIKPKIYSPETCLWIPQKLNKEYSNNPKNHKKICDFCGKEYYGTARQKYCSSTCFNKAYYKRKKEKRTIKNN